MTRMEALRADPQPVPVACGFLFMGSMPASMPFFALRKQLSDRAPRPGPAGRPRRPPISVGKEGHCCYLSLYAQIFHRLYYAQSRCAASGSGDGFPGHGPAFLLQPVCHQRIHPGFRRVQLFQGGFFGCRKPLGQYLGDLRSTAMTAKKSVGVLMGGISPEHPVSLVSGTGMLKNLDRERYQGFPILISKDNHWIWPDPSSHPGESGTYGVDSAE